MKKVSRIGNVDTPFEQCSGDAVSRTSQEEVDAIDYWRFCHELSVIQAALLILGEDPSRWQDTIDKTYSAMDRPAGYDAIMTALINSIRAMQLDANIIYYTDEGGSDLGPDWNQTTIKVHDLRAWLQWRGVKNGFFFPEPVTGPDYLSETHPNYSKKLAAAVQAWKAVSENPELRRGKTVKQAIIVWLEQHANEFGLTKDDGTPNEQGIEDVAKVSNWATKGGAPETPGSD